MARFDLAKEIARVEEQIEITKKNLQNTPLPAKARDLAKDPQSEAVLEEHLEQCRETYAANIEYLEAYLSGLQRQKDGKAPFYPV